LEQKQVEVLVEYYSSYIPFRMRGPRATPQFLKYGVYADKPVTDFIGSLTKRYYLSCIYGKNDWMDRESMIERFGQADNTKDYKAIEPILIKDSGHMVVMNNVESLATCVGDIIQSYKAWDIQTYNKNGHSSYLLNLYGK
jgi:phosphorylcholine metabolism protein LicD